MTHRWRFFCHHHLWLTRPTRVTSAGILLGALAGMDRVRYVLADDHGIVARTDPEGVISGPAGGWQEIQLKHPVDLHLGHYVLVVETDGATDELSTPFAYLA